MNDNNNDHRGEDGQPKRKKRAPMFYKEYLQKDKSDKTVPRTTLINARTARQQALPAHSTGSVGISAPECSVRRKDFSICKNQNLIIEVRVLCEYLFIEYKFLFPSRAPE